MLTKLGQATVLVLVLGSLGLREAPSLPSPTPRPAKMRCLLLAKAYRQEIQDEIEAPSQAATALTTSNFVWSPVAAGLHEYVVFGRAVPTRDLSLESVSLLL